MPFGTHGSDRRFPSRKRSFGEWRAPSPCHLRQGGKPFRFRSLQYIRHPIPMHPIIRHESGRCPSRGPLFAIEKGVFPPTFRAPCLFFSPVTDESQIKKNPSTPCRQRGWVPFEWTFDDKALEGFLQKKRISLFCGRLKVVRDVLQGIFQDVGRFGEQGFFFFVQIEFDDFANALAVDDGRQADADIVEAVRTVG